MTPATAASAAPMTKVSEMVRSTFTPHSPAMVKSCWQARCARPSAVRPIRYENATIRITVNSMIVIWM